MRKRWVKVILLPSLMLFAFGAVFVHMKDFEVFGYCILSFLAVCVIGMLAIKIIKK